jgi:homospermidine synthase
MAKEYENAATCVVTHGANPGLVSHFVKDALMDMADELNMDISAPKDQQGWAELAEELGVRVIHISERDTQLVDRPKKKGEFVNTWSCEGFWAEGRAPAEIGFGTHEPGIPHHGFAYEKGPKNAIYFDKPGVSMLVKSWVPIGGEINGFVIQHSEAVTISEYLTAHDEEGNPTYRPTVHYAYCPCDAALVSVHEFRGHELDMQSKTRIAKKEITRGIDELGVLLLGDRISWWYGSQLGIDETRELLPDNNATTLQVVASLLGALAWMVEHPNQGYVEPESIPYDKVLKYAFPYLGPISSAPTKWRPDTHVNKLYSRKFDNGNPWAFSNFRTYS